MSGPRPYQAAAGGYDFSQSMSVDRQFKFGPRDSHSLSVDQTLAHLFDTLTVECSGVLVQPQWKHFRHIQMLKSDRIRLSNGIWRSWHLQFQKRRAPLYCRFDIEPKLEHHNIQESVVLEGKYWKRKESAVATEYRKWRLHYHKKNKKRPEDPYLAEVKLRGTVVMEKLLRQSQTMLTNQPKASFFTNTMDTDPLFYLMDTSSSFGDSGMGIGLQQPNLDMLNPMLDDFLNKLEPMDVALPRSLGGVSFSAPSQPPTSTVQLLATPSFGAQGTPSLLTYQTPYTMSTQQDGFTPPPQQDGFTPPPPQQDAFTPPPPQQNAFTPPPPQQQSLSPTAFLNMSPAESGRGNLDLSQLSNYPMKPEPLLNEPNSSNQSACLYSLPTYPQGSGPAGYGSMSMSTSEDVYSMQASIQRKVDDMEGMFSVTPSQLLPSKHTSPHHHTSTPDSFQFPTTSTLTEANQYTPTPSGSHMTSARDHMMNQPSFVRVSSAGNLITSSPVPSSRPPLERGKSEPIQRLREQVQKLSAQNEKQILEIDKQKSLAERQYSELLHTVLQQAATGNASEQQKLALQSVFSNPGLVNILRDVLSTMPPPGVGDQTASGQVVQRVGGASPALKMPLSELHTKRSGLASDVTSPPNIMSPTDFAKVTGVSDFQSRLLVAAASQAAQSTTTSTPLTPLTYSNYISGGSDSETTPTGAALAQLRMKPAHKLSSNEKVVYKEMRRQSHISAEQKRRGSIKQGFDHLQSLVVNLSAYPSGKVSKAVVLEKTIEHVHHCTLVREERDRKVLALKKEIEELNSAIAHCQEMLPASGVPATRQRFEENRQRFREYVQRRTQQNYKFWIFSVILKQLFESYNSMVSTGSVDELCRTVLAWFEQNCALPALRPVVMDSLRELSQKTSILTDPSQVPRQLAQYAQQEMQLHRQEQEKARTTRFSSFS